MNEWTSFHRELVERLPLPLAQLYRRTYNTKTGLERHLTAIYLWEVALKQLASAAVASYLKRDQPDPRIAESLHALERPALGHWWQVIRGVVPYLARCGDPRFAAVDERLFGPASDQFPQAARLSARLVDAQSGPGRGVRIAELVDRMIGYRNRVLGHGIAARPAQTQEEMARLLWEAAAEVWGTIDVLAGGRLVYLPEITREMSGGWLVDRLELSGEMPVRVASLPFAETRKNDLPVPGRLYIEFSNQGESELLGLHPFEVYEADTNEISFWNSRRGRQVEYLCYTSGRLQRRPESEAGQIDFLQSTSDAAAAGPPADASSFAAAGPLTASTASGEASPAPDAPAGRSRVGEYELLSVLGRGGMGVVYRALQPSLQRQVALKCLTRQGGDLEARFAGEIRALGRVNHPNLVRIFSSGFDRDIAYYAMELIEGAPLSYIAATLRATAAEGRTVDLAAWKAALDSVVLQSQQAEAPVEGAASDGRPAAAPGPRRSYLGLGQNYVDHIVDLVRQVADAVHALHEAGVLHRDIKPGNIMVTSDGSQAVLMDLGLANLHDDDRTLTSSRQFIGTVNYISPEQILGLDVDRRADVYSLGVTLWEMLTLRPPYGAADSNPLAMMLRIHSERLEPPSRFNPLVPSELDAIVLKCLEKDASLRYQSAAELAGDLGRFLARLQAPVGGAPPAVARVGRARMPRSARLFAEGALAAYAIAVTALALASRTGRWMGGIALVGCVAALGAACGYAISLWRRPFLPPSSERSPEKRLPPAASRSGRMAKARADSRRTHDEAHFSHVVLVYYPAPIALAYRRFRRADTKEPRARMELLFKAYEATLKYLVLVGLADLFHCLVEARGKRREDLIRLLDPPAKTAGNDQDPHPYVFDFLRVPTSMSLGSWVHALRALAKALDREPGRFIQELPTVCRSGNAFDTDMLGWILSQPHLAEYVPASLLSTQDLILSQRNRAAHLPSCLEYTADQCNDVIGSCQPKLNQLLDKIRFVRSYPLGFFDRVFQHGPVKNAKGRYHLHSCMGVLGTTSRKGVSLESDTPLVDRSPFLVSPHSPRLLYLTPFYTEREADHSQRPTLYGFEAIANKAGRYLTEVRSCAIDALDPWTQTLHPTPQDNFDWLIDEMTERPICQPVPDARDLAQDLLPSRGDLADKLLDNTYRLEGLIAEGGFAKVYSARTADDNLVAVKVLDLETQEPFDEFVGRFQREFDKLKLAGERHPGIIRCYKWGLGLIDKSDYPYYSMEFADGGDLGARIDERRAELRETIPWCDQKTRADVVREFRSIVDAVAHLHTQMDFVHRDIKPSNVLLVGGEIRLADFGLVKPLRPTDRRPSSKPPGTPVYRAPEQERGDEVDATADVYSLGIVLAELATGALPEPKLDAAGGSTLDRLAELKHLPKPLRPAYEGLAQLDEPLRDLIYRCTDVDPRKRPRDASVVLKEFEHATART